MWIDKLDNGKFKYVERYYDHEGKQRFVSKTLTKDSPQAWKQAQKILDKRIADIKEAEAKKTTTTFKAVADDWLKVKAEKAKPSTMTAYRNRVDLLTNEIGDAAMNELNAGTINKIFLDWLLGGLKYKTVSERYKICKNVFVFAKDYGYIDEDNVSNNLKLEKINLSEARDDKYLEADEASELFEAMKESGHTIWANMLYLQMVTGMRFGEVAALNVSDIDLSAGEIIISKTWDRVNKVCTKPKNGKIRYININKQTVTFLRRILIERQHLLLLLGLRDIEIVFFNEDGGYQDLSKVNNKLHEFEKDKSLTSHIFRHTFITRMVENGVSTNLVAEHVGHATTEITERVYTHFTARMNTQLKEAISKVEF